MPVNIPRLAVCVSGSGRTLENLILAIQRGELIATIAMVIASRPCRGETIARERGIPTEVIRGELPSEHLLELVHRHTIDAVVLAGYLKKVPVPQSLEGRIVNIHPALLPRFGGPGMYGDRVHQAVLDAARTQGITESGCTVHLCTEHYDEGDILLQLRCPILADDTPQTLAARVFELEKIAYPTALRGLLDSLRDHGRDRA